MRLSFPTPTIGMKWFISVESTGVEYELMSPSLRGDVSIIPSLGIGIMDRFEASSPISIIERERNEKFCLKSTGGKNRKKLQVRLHEALGFSKWASGASRWGPPSASFSISMRSLFKKKDRAKEN